MSIFDRVSQQMETWWSKEAAVLLSLMLLAFGVRMYRLTTPLADWHSWRQADTASVTREYVKHGIDFWHPTYHDLSSIPNNLDNSAHGYRMVEFPLINAGLAKVLRLFPQLPLVATSRFFSVLASLGTLASLYFFVRLYWGRGVASLSALIFALLPYAVFYSRVVLPEPYMLFLSTASVCSFAYWVKGKFHAGIWVSAVTLALALLLKPFATFLAPVFAVLLLHHRFWGEVWGTFSSVLSNSKKKRSLSSLILPGAILGLQLLLFLSISFLPLLQWRAWIVQFPEGIPASDWLFNSNGIRFRPAWFRWLGYERLIKLFLGYLGMLLFMFAFFPRFSQLRTLRTYIFSKNRTFAGFIKISRLILTAELFILLAWWVSILLYFSVIATGNVHHDYYQALMIPVVSLTLAVGMHKLSEWTVVLLEQMSHTSSKPRPERNRYVSALFVAAIFTVSLFSAWQYVKGYFNVNHWEYVEAGRAVDQLTPPDAKIIAPAFGDTQFLFQTNRTGWPIGGDIEDKIKKGATHYVTTAYDDEAKTLETKHTVIEKNPKFLLLELKAQPDTE